MPDFKSLDLAAPIQKALGMLGYTTPTPIQMQAIPKVLNGRDLMGIAQTGTGKTAAFSLPLLSHIAKNEKDPPKRGARALILAPTRELASQIAVSVKDYGKCMPWLTVTCVFGGVPISKQIKNLVRGNDVLVATPGRLIDLLGRKDVRLDQVEFLILDEADQMMDMGFIHALRQIMPHLPKERQTLFFSATMNPQIKKLAAQFLTNPEQVSVAPANTTAEKIEQSVTFVSQQEKQDLLAVTLLDDAIERALVFTRTKHGADRVVKKLARVGIDSVAIHGNKSQSKRQRALEAFRSGTIKYLIATDVAARGIDIEGISHVINFEIPNVPEQYVHRIGRTARAGREGRAMSFIAPGDERKYLKDIQKLLKITIPTEPLPENFLQKAKEVNKRAPLPKPEGEPFKETRNTPRKNKQRRDYRPKNRKKPASAEDLLAATDKPKSDKPKSDKSPYAKSKRPRHPGQKSEGKRGGPSSGGSNKPGGNKSYGKPKSHNERNAGGSNSAPSKTSNQGFKRKNRPQGR